jgi:hypothetical protein
MTAVRDQLYQTGDQVLESGLYLSHHVGVRCSWPEAILEADNVFPACPTCGDNVRYVLAGTAAGSLSEVGSPANRRSLFHTESVNPLTGLSPRRQYLHLTAYRCDQCRGPVVAGSLGTRETAIARETQISLLGGICLACGNRQDHLPDAGATRGFMPVEWA